jgi:NAD-dependent dihydropyrimidine dehydrogenase PreA subunit
MSTGQSDFWHGVPRSEIAWNPTVVAERCAGCGLCVTSCGRGVYAFDYEHRLAVVVAPQSCMVGCTTCATICLQDAIEFPSRGYIRGVIRLRRIVRQSKSLINEQPDTYAVAARAEAAA